MLQKILIIKTSAVLPLASKHSISKRFVWLPYVIWTSETGDKPSHLELSGIKGSWDSISKLTTLPSLASSMGTHSLLLQSLRWWIISGWTVLIFGHHLPAVFISVSLWLPVLFSSIHFFQLDLTLLLSPYLWICSTHTFANMPWVRSALSIWFLAALSVAVPHTPPSVMWPHLILFRIFGFPHVSVC